MNEPPMNDPKTTSTPHLPTPESYAPVKWIISTVLVLLIGGGGLISQSYGIATIILLAFILGMFREIVSQAQDQAEKWLLERAKEEQRQ